MTKKQTIKINVMKSLHIYHFTAKLNVLYHNVNKHDKVCFICGMLNVM